MTAEIVEFPGNPPPEGYSQEYIDKLHSEAFRDLEDSISECATMANIALQLAEKAIESRDDKADKAMFAVFHVARMLRTLKRNYHAAWHGENRNKQCD